MDGFGCPWHLSLVSLGPPQLRVFSPQTLCFVPSPESYLLTIPSKLLFNTASNSGSNMSQYTISGSKNCLNTTNSFNNVWNNCTVADDLSQLLTWLSPLDPGLRHSDIQERRVEGIGEWLMGTEEFRRWCAVGGTGQGGEAVLFGYGNPGVGKTFIRYYPGKATERG